jgi:hypothetical protein
VDGDLGLVGYGPEYPADVLDDAAFELDREGQEDGVEGWAVETFADEARGGDQDRSDTACAHEC